MAYNRPYNPDELPRFAEPESKNPKTQSPQPSSGGSSLRYDSKPPPPLPDQQQQRPAPDSRYGPSSGGGGGPALDSRYGPSSGGGGGGGRYAGVYGTVSPPPGSAPPPSGGYQQRPTSANRPPPSPAPRDNDGDAALRPLFRAVDKAGTGQLSEKELSSALVNGDWTAFDPQTVRMMIRMFDSDRSGTIGFEEFCGLWSFLASWRTLFDRFDADKSGNISLEEFRNALVAFRYRLSPEFTELLFRTYDKRSEGVMSFDLFVQSCISLKRMTDLFKKFDEDRDGFITLSFEDFLTAILKQLK